MEHTPTPWKLIGMKHTTRIQHWDGEKHTLVAVVNAPRPMYYDKPTVGSLNADFITQACNSHDHLVNILKIVQSWAEKENIQLPGAIDIRSALKSAGVSL